MKTAQGRGRTRAAALDGAHPGSALRAVGSREPAAALLIAGSYEKAICGWELGKKRSVTPVFQHLAHLGPVKAVASQGKYAVSGGNDEEIRIYNVRKRREVGSLMKHQAPITALRFSKKANSLVSGSDAFAGT